MSEDTQDQTETRDTDQAEPKDDSQEQSAKAKGTDDKDSTLAKVSEERRQARERAQKAEQELSKLQASQREAEEAKAKEEGKFKELLEAREKELEALKQDIAKRDLQARKAAIAKTHGIPDEFVDRLKGDTDEDLENDAKAVAKLLTKRDAPDTDGGAKTPAGVKKPNKSDYSDPARWGLRR